MNIQTSKRIMCCLLAVLLLGMCVIRPMVITANATGAETAAMAGFVGIAPEVAIPIIIALLGVTVVAANWEDICGWVDNAFDSITTWINDEEVVPAYKYNDQLYVTEDIAYSVASTVNSYFDLKYEDAWELGKQFSKMYIVELSSSSSQKEFVVFADSAPYTQTVTGEEQLVVRKPCVVYSKAYGMTEIYDYSGETGTAHWSFLDATITGLDVSLIDNLTVPVIDLGATVTVTTPENEKEKAIPIAPSDTTPYEDAKTEVKVETDTGTETVPGTSTVDLSGVLSWLKAIWSAITELASKITAPIVEAVTAAKTQIDSSASAIILQLVKGIGSVNTAIDTGITTITDTITDTIAQVIEKLLALGLTLADILSAIKELASKITAPIVEAVTAAKTQIDSSASAIILQLVKGIGSVNTAIDTGITTITDTITNTIEAIIEWLISIGASLSDILEWIKTLADSIASAIADVLTAVFIPTPGYFDVKIAEMREEFVFLDGALNTFSQFKNFLMNLGSKPPVIYINLAAATGSYYFGGETIFVDMRWYESYKPTMDGVLSAFLWAWFIWRFMIALPGIIQGFSGYAPQNNGQTETGMVLASQWYER